MEPELCREALARIIAEETAGLSELAALLDREHVLLGAADIQALNAAIAARKLCLLRIVRAGEERNALLRGLSYSCNAAGLEDFIRWCDAGGELRRGWQACTAAAAHCRTLNDRNGALVSARLQHVQARLGVLLNGRPDPVTYGRKGGYALPSLGRVLTTEV